MLQGENFSIGGHKQINENGLLAYKVLVLKKILETQNKIREKKRQKITYAAPILWHEENPVFYPRTINVIQGKAGAHKSRLAETICAALLKTDDCVSEHLNFSCKEKNKFNVCYVDTERNLSDQFPDAMQHIQLKAGYTLNEDPGKFDYLSLLQFDREKRFETLNIYIEHIQKQYQGHLFIVLDVITDCVFNFNDTKDSMKLIDLMNKCINEYDVTFLCLIHENPGAGNKARGHLGTELINKSSTVMQIGFVLDAKNQRTSLIKVAYLKCRNSKMHEPFYVQYSSENEGLIESSQENTTSVLDQKNQKAQLPQFLQILGEVVQTEMSRRELIEILAEETNCAKRTIISRIQQIIQDKHVIEREGNEYELSSRAAHREIVYFLKEKI